jgi:hypothetical protein
VVSKLFCVPRICHPCRKIILIPISCINCFKYTKLRSSTLSRVTYVLIFVYLSYVLGCLIKKQRIPLPGCDRDTGPYYRLLDLVVGGSVVFYGKELRITGVDAFTRDFLVKMGVDVQDNEPIPDDPYFNFRKKVTSRLFYTITTYLTSGMLLDLGILSIGVLFAYDNTDTRLIGRNELLFFLYFADQPGLHVQV